MPEPLVATKLHIPPVPPGWVRRTRLVERLDAGSTAKLTLVSAPAGFGKTTLLSEWAHGGGSSAGSSTMRFSWLSLDRDDNDPDRFWAYFIASLRSIPAGLRESCLGLLQAHSAPSIKALLARLINGIAEQADILVMVLDDYHEITAKSIHEDLAFLIDRMPAQVHLAMATRCDPPLPLGRLRGRGQLAEFRTDDLRFTVDEARTFFNEAMALGLSDPEIALLESRAEGWIASLRIAALSMQGQGNISEFLKSFDGTHRHIEDYLAEEVIARQDPGIQSFLMHTSVLERLCGPLCSAVTGDDNGQEMLERLELANVFLSAMDNNRKWFRYHQLLADVLRKQLDSASPALVPVLHRRASEWFERQGLLGEAINHSLAAGDFDRAADLIQAVAIPLISECRVSAPSVWLSRLPQETIKSRPWLCISLASVHMSRGQLDEAEALLDAVEGVLQRSETAAAGPDTAEGRIRNHLIAQRTMLACARGSTEETIRTARETLDRTGKDQPTVLCMLAFGLGADHLMKGEMAEASRYLDEAAAYGQTTGNTYIALVAMGHLADIQARQGSLQRAVDTCRTAIRLATEWGGGEPLAASAYAHICLAYVLYQWNRVDEATDYVTRGIELAQQGAQMTLAALAIPDLALLSELVEEATGVLEAFNELRGIVSASQNLMMVSRLAAAWRAQLALAAGDVKQAELWGASLKDRDVEPEDVPDLVLEFEHLTLVRLHLDRGEVDDVPYMLERLLEKAEKQERTGSAIEILILQSIALRAQGRPEEALARLERALALAEPEGYVRVFVDEGEPMAELLRYAAVRGVRRKYVAGLLASLSGPQRARALRDSSLLCTDSLAEPLTERELEVLQLLAAGKSNRQIADDLMVVTGTVKAHLLNIYGKLDVHSRTQALARSRELSLI